MARELAVFKPRPLMPCLGGYVIDPSGVGAREGQHIEGVAFLLIGVTDGVRDVPVLGDGVLNGVRGYAHPGVTVGAVDDALPPGVGA